MSFNSARILLALFLLSGHLVHAAPHCPGGQIAPTRTTTTTTTTTITTTIHHTVTIMPRPSSRPGSATSSAAASKHKSSQSSAHSASSSLTVPFPSKASIISPHASLPTSSSILSSILSTPSNDCDISINNGNGDSNGSDDENGDNDTNSEGNENGSENENGSGISNGNTNNSPSGNGAFTTQNGNSDMNGGENSNGNDDKGAVNDFNGDRNSNGNDIQNGNTYGSPSSPYGVHRTPMKLCCDSKGQADSLVITLLANTLGLDLSNKTGLIGVGCTVIGEGSIHDALDCPHSLLECGSFLPYYRLGSSCSV